MFSIFSIGLAKEVESPENPGALEKRVALVPKDVATLVKAGVRVYVEEGAGEGVGFSDEDYTTAGAALQSHDAIYQDKDMVIKFKGPALENISQMKPGTILFCMAHFHSYPDRAKLLEEQRINVVAMEEILESPKQQSDNEILGRTAMAEALGPFIAVNAVGSLRVRVVGWNNTLRYCLRRASNRDPRSVKLLQADVKLKDLDALGGDSLYVYDSRDGQDSYGLIEKLIKKKCHVFDVAKFAEDQGREAIKMYREDHPPLEFGKRRIQCLHETGMAGARYGCDLLRQNKPDLKMRNAKAVVLGYGNVGQGAIQELHDQGIRDVNILGRTHTTKGRIDYWLKDADVVVNGAEQPVELRGKNFLVSNEQIKTLLPDGSVVIDLVGGSPTNRSPVEAVLSCTFLTDPHFVQDGVTISALWGWPMMGMMRETAIRYSGQILDVLIGNENLVRGLDLMPPGLRRALVCGPFD